MDIVAESLSANTLKAQNVTVRGQDVLKWFESKLSSSVSFVGVFDDLSAAPVKNGAVAIVGSKDYIYSSTMSAWQEFGDEGQIGGLTQAVMEVSNKVTQIEADIDSIRNMISSAITSTYEYTQEEIEGDTTI